MREILERGLAELGVDAACAPGLTAFSQLLLEKNKVMNLTASRRMWRGCICWTACTC